MIVSGEQRLLMRRMQILQNDSVTSNNKSWNLLHLLIKKLNFAVYSQNCCFCIEKNPDCPRGNVARHFQPGTNERFRLLFFSFFFCRRLLQSWLCHVRSFMCIAAPFYEPGVSFVRCELNKQPICFRSCYDCKHFSRTVNSTPPRCTSTNKSVRSESLQEPDWGERMEHPTGAGSRWLYDGYFSAQRQKVHIMQSGMSCAVTCFHIVHLNICISNTFLTCILVGRDAKAKEWISNNQNIIFEISGNSDRPATLADITTLKFGYIWNVAACAAQFFFLFFICNSLLLKSLISVVRHRMTLIITESDIKKKNAEQKSHNEN